MSDNLFRYIVVRFIVFWILSISQFNSNIEIKNYGERKEVLFSDCILWLEEYEKL